MFPLRMLCFEKLQLRSVWEIRVLPTTRTSRAATIGAFFNSHILMYLQVSSRIIPGVYYCTVIIIFAKNYLHDAWICRAWRGSHCRALRCLIAPKWPCAVECGSYWRNLFKMLSADETLSAWQWYSSFCAVSFPHRLYAGSCPILKCVRLNTL